MDFEAFEKKYWKQEKRLKDADMRKIEKEVFNEQTVDTIYRLALKGELDYLGGVVSTGKEANVFKGYTKDNKPRAYKIYRTETADFKAMWPYLEGDRRFENTRKQKRHIIIAWCKKEFKNLTVAHKAGCRVPEPLAYKNNILVMEFIGDNMAAPLLKDVALNDAESVFWEIAKDLQRLYRAGLVHADISEFNIMWWQDNPWIIDIGQGVLLSHPMAETFLERDAYNLTNFFIKKGVDINANKLLKFIQE
jgi:RIO kinase 1